MRQSKINIDLHADNYIEELSKDSSFEAVLSNARKRQVLRSMRLYKHSNILEIGCGLNPLFPYINDYKKYIIVEPSKEFAEFARNIDKKGRDVLVINGFLEDVISECRGQSFDFIFLSGVLHQVPQPKSLLRTLHGLCSRDSVVHINVPNAFSFHRLLAVEMGYIETIFEKSETNAKLQVNWIFDKDRLIQLVQENKFEVLNFGTYFIKLFTNEQIEKIIATNILKKDVINGLENMIKYMPDMGCEMFVNLKAR
jgi:2-polyprenyl-3-methyl-5-hydroxy-6-metoxy-1,4-benzoquinol methylase